jgi:hypothetical protein
VAAVHIANAPRQASGTASEESERVDPAAEDEKEEAGAAVVTPEALAEGMAEGMAQLAVIERLEAELRGFSDAMAAKQ